MDTKQVILDTKIVTLATVLELLDDAPPAMARKLIIDYYNELREEDALRHD
jgi:hypothetical protein